MVTVDRFEYAWRWFSLHAAQRYSMFNFFMVFAGILANAFVLLIDNDHHAEAGILALLGMAASVFFLLLEARNRQLVKIGEQLLSQIELEEDPERRWRGPITLDAANEPALFLKHRVLIGGIQFFAIIGFGAGAIWAFIP